MFGWENWLLCQIPRFQPQYNVHEYGHRSVDLEQYVTVLSRDLGIIGGRNGGRGGGYQLIQLTPPHTLAPLTSHTSRYVTMKWEDSIKLS
jgi:hypothetical protein